MNGTALAAFLPLFVALGAVASYFVAKLLPARRRAWTGSFAAVWLAAAFVLYLFAESLGIRPADSPWPVLRVTDVGVLLGLLATGLGALAALGSQGRIRADGPVQMYYPLLLLALAGAAAVGLAGDLFTLFVAVELSALPSYALVAYRTREDPRAVSAAVTYLLQGVAGTLTALLGVALMYLAGGTLTIAALPARLASADPLLVGLAATLVLVGYGVKLAIVPLHTWLPEAYARSPGGVTAIMAGSTKISVLAAMLLTFSALPSGAVAPGLLGVAVNVLAVLTMTVGNLLALNQTDLRRMLAYSSVAQMGYILLGFGIGMQYGLALGFAAGLLYAVAYGLAKGGAFLAADVLAADAGTAEIAGLRGTGARHPAIGVSLAIFLFGLIGVPATAGFLGKLLLFEAGLSAGTTGGVLLALALAANSALSLGYYVPALSTILFGGHEARPARAAAAADGGAVRLPRSTSAAVVGLAAATVILGLVPGWLFELIGRAGGVLFPGGGP